MSQTRWIRLAPVADCPVGRGRFVETEGHELAIFHLADPDRFIVTRNACPHAGGNLAAGEIRDGTVTCPWHHWTFDLDTGACPLAENVTLRRYECRVEDGWILANLPEV
jgi:nitrite reductase (NADH) small subunit